MECRVYTVRFGLSYYLYYFSMIYTPHLACCRKDESLNNVTLADVYFGRAEKIRRKREKTKLKTIELRREEYLKQKMNLQNKKQTLTLQN